LQVLDLNFVFNLDKEQNRTHSSLFFTYSTLSSIDTSDLLNKCLTCDSEGAVYLNKADDTRNWAHRNKIMNYSFCKVAQFSTELFSSGDKETENNYKVNVDELKQKKTIKVDLTPSNNKDTLRSDNYFNSYRVDLNNLTKIRWNQNVNSENIYACSSVSGFVFIHKINEFDSSEVIEQLKKEFCSHANSKFNE